MTITSSMNIIVGQGTAIKEVHNVRKQNLELGQHFIAQHAEGQKKEENSRVQESEHHGRVEEDKEEKEKKQQRQKGDEEKSREGRKTGSKFGTEGNLIDITV